jgi:hypothetical protein
MYAQQYVRQKFVRRSTETVRVLSASELFIEQLAVAVVPGNLEVKVQSSPDGLSTGFSQREGRKKYGRYG